MAGLKLIPEMAARDENVRVEARAGIVVLAQTLAVLQSAVTQLRVDVDNLMHKQPTGGGEVSV
jgi:hypothetical protein